MLMRQMIRKLKVIDVSNSYLKQYVRFHNHHKTPSDDSSSQSFPAKFFDKEQMPAAVQSSFNGNDDEEENDMEEMFVDGPAGVEWGGPTRGGARPEPTRFGDWERKGRASDF